MATTTSKQKIVYLKKAFPAHTLVFFYSNLVQPNASSLSYWADFNLNFVFDIHLANKARLFKATF
jgi:hypothetical protein